MVLMQKPSVIDAPSGGAPEKAPRWDLLGTEGCGGGNRVSWCSWMFSGYVGTYRRNKQVGGATRVEGAPRGVGAPLPRGFLVGCLTSTPSPLDHVCSKNHIPEGFILFGLHLIFLFYETLKQAKKTAILVGPPVNRLVPKIIQKCKIKPVIIPNR